MKKSRSIIKIILYGIISLIAVVIIGLIINNRIAGARYRSTVTDSAVLSEDEIDMAARIFAAVSESGNNVFPGLGEENDLIIFNDKYEFLIIEKGTDLGSGADNYEGWELTEFSQVLNKNIFRRTAIDPQAFAVLTGNRWIGSISTLDRLNKFLANEIPIFMPPQLTEIDEEYYIGIAIHEMTHALQGNEDTKRIETIGKLHDICSVYYSDNNFNSLLEKEGGLLEEAIDAATVEDTAEYAMKFLDTRDDRRNKCKMTETQISDEKEFEWLEGMGRYSEYYFSENTSSYVRKNLLRIKFKVTPKNDDRYYATGMAQAMILDKLYPDWKKEAQNPEFSFEDELKKVLDR